ncbi:MAG: hydroxylamine reductase [Spirochaetota bacterium]
MFCFQCQEAAKNIGCTTRGVCGKSNEVANLQDLLLFVLKGIAWYKDQPADQKITIPGLDRFFTESLFSTVTNTNFDSHVFEQRIEQALDYRNALRKEIENYSSGILPSHKPEAAVWTPKTKDEYAEKAASVGVLSCEDEDIRSLRELLIYGVKGISAYNEHADNLGYSDPEVTQFMYRALSASLNDSLTVDELVSLVLECGKFGVSVMSLLDKANTSSYGNPEMSEVSIETGSNPGILISGHDLKDMEELLNQTEGTGVDVYTHGEMLPANYYPAFKKYSHLKGNYGGSWWKQASEIESFNGPVLFTTNCIVPPKDSYKDRVYTTGTAGFDGCVHIPDRDTEGSKDFSQIIEHAKKCPPPKQIETGSIVGGFAHDQVFKLADKVVDAVNSGAIRKFFVMAGCDGRMKSREYYTEFAQKLPDDTVILTAGCAKYRYNKLPLGDIGGIPRVLDAGQCNDSYSLVVIALKLKEIFELEDVNELPLAYNIAWYEQKAVIVLLALLYLGVKNIHLGPTLPAFLSPNVANVLVNNFGIAGINTVDEDLKLFLGA